LSIGKFQLIKAPCLLKVAVGRAERACSIDTLVCVGVLRGVGV